MVLPIFGCTVGNSAGRSLVLKFIEIQTVLFVTLSLLNCYTDFNKI